MSVFEDKLREMQKKYRGLGAPSSTAQTPSVPAGAPTAAPSTTFESRVADISAKYGLPATSIPKPTPAPEITPVRPPDTMSYREMHQAEPVEPVAPLPVATLSPKERLLQQAEEAQNAAAAPKLHPSFVANTTLSNPDPNARPHKTLSDYNDEVKEGLLRVGKGLVNSIHLPQIMAKSAKAEIEHRIPVEQLPPQFQDAARREREQALKDATPENFAKFLDENPHMVEPVAKTLEGGGQLIGDLLQASATGGILGSAAEAGTIAKTATKVPQWLSRVLGLTAKGVATMGPLALSRQAVNAATDPEHFNAGKAAGDLLKETAQGPLMEVGGQFLGQPVRRLVGSAIGEKVPAALTIGAANLAGGGATGSFVGLANVLPHVVSGDMTLSDAAKQLGHDALFFGLLDTITGFNRGEPVGARGGAARELNAYEFMSGERSPAKEGYREFKPGMGVWVKVDPATGKESRLFEMVKTPDGQATSKYEQYRAERFKQPERATTAMQETQPTEPRALPSGQAEVAPVERAPAVTPDRQRIIREANPGMDERAIVYIVNTMKDLPDAEFKAFAERMGKPETSAPVAPTETAPAGVTERSSSMPAPAATSSTGLTEVGSGMASGLTDSMYDMLWNKVQKGEATELGAPSAVLQAAKVVRDAGGLQTRDEFVNLARDVQAVRNGGAIGQAYQDGIRAVVQRYLPQQTPVTQQERKETLPEFSMAEQKAPMTREVLKGQAEATADRIGTTLGRFLEQPNGYKALLATPQNPLARYWLQAKMDQMGKPIPQKVSDLMVELNSLMGQNLTKAVRDNIQMVQSELDQSIQAALTDTKTPVERLLAGEQAIPLTGQKVSQDQLNGRASAPTQGQAELPKANQSSLFDSGTQDQLREYNAELADIRQNRAESDAAWDVSVQELATRLAKDATKANEGLRKDFWKRIKEHGLIRGYKGGHLKEDLTSRIPAFLKNSTLGRPLDEIASAMGYESDEALVRDIEAFSKMGPVKPEDFTTEAEALYAYSEEGANLQAMRDYYRQAEESVQAAITELEGRSGGQTQAAGTDQRAESRGLGQEVSGDRPVDSQEGQGVRRQPTTAEEQLTGATRKGGSSVATPSGVDTMSGGRPALTPTNQGNAAPADAPVVRRRDIVKFLEKKLNLPIRVGNFRVPGAKGVIGVFKRHEGVVRTKLAEDIPVIAHEVGHYLDQQLKLQDPQFTSELVKLGQATSPASAQTAYKRKEGVAEFMRLYLTDPVEAQKQAPTYYAEFEKRITQDPEIAEALLEAQGQIKMWREQPAKARILGSMSIGEKEQKRPFSFSTLYAKTIDEMEPLRQVTKVLSGGKQLQTAEDPFVLAWLARGWAGKAETFLKYGVVDENYNKVGPSLKEILDGVDNLDDFRAYLVAKRAKELATRADSPIPIENSVGVGVTGKDVDAVIADLGGQYDKAQKDLVKFQDAVLHELVKAGVIDQDGANAMRLMNQDYVPFFRLFDENLGTFNFKGAKRFANLQNPVSKIKGSGRTIIDPLESIVKNVYSMINIAERQKVMGALVDLAEKTGGMGGVIEEIDPKSRPVTFDLRSIEKALKAQGVDTKSIDLDQVATLFEPLTKASARDNQVTVFRDGERKVYQLDPDLYRAVLGMDQESTNFAIKLFSYPASWLRAGATLSPDFQARNPLKDQWSAAIFSKYGYVPGWDLARGLFHAVGKTDLYWKWQAAGGAQANLVSVDRDYLQKNLKELLKEKGKFTLHVLNPLEALRTISEFMENATRLGEFSKGVTQEGATGEGLRKAALASRDVTIDFSRSGAQTRNINRLTAFFNAAIQGTDKTFREFKARPGKMTAKSVLYYTLPSVILYLLNRENPWWQEKAEWQKDAFWFVPLDWTNPTQSKHFLWIPKAHAIGMAFGAAPERILRWIDKDDKKAFDGFASRMMDSLVPTTAKTAYFPVPTAVMPLLENITNYDTYTDLPIVPASEQRLDPELQYSPYTSETAKLFGHYFNQSPRKVEHLVRGYTGGLGSYTLQAVDKGIDALGAGNSPTHPDRGAASYPVVKSFLRDAGGPGQGASIDDFYQVLDQANKLDDAKARKKMGLPPRQLNPDEAQLVRSAKTLRAVDGTLQDLRKERIKIEKDQNMTSAAKRDRLNRIDLQMTNLARKALGKPPISE